MVDLSNTIIAKSDQLNSDDLIGGPRTIRVTRVAGNSDKEQPISIYYEGDGGKPYKPGKSMRRVLVNFWGKDGEAYVGRSMTLFRDPNVEFGGIKVGGIRISHMSHLEDSTEMALAVTRGAKRKFTVKHLRVEQASDGIDAARAAINDAATLADLERTWRHPDMRPFRDALLSEMQARKAELADGPSEGRTTAQHGDQHDDAGEDDDTPDPRRAVADGMIARCQRAAILGDVISVEAELGKVYDVMPYDMAAEVDEAVRVARERLTGGAK